MPSSFSIIRSQGTSSDIPSLFMVMLSNPSDSACLLDFLGATVLIPRPLSACFSNKRIGGYRRQLSGKLAVEDLGSFMVTSRGFLTPSISSYVRQHVSPVEDLIWLGKTKNFRPLRRSFSLNPWISLPMRPWSSSAGSPD